MECIDIAVAADGKYFHGLFVTVCSIAKYADPNVQLRINVLDGGIYDDDWVLLRKTVSKLHPNSTFVQIEFDENLFDKYPAWNSNRMAYARLILPETLPNVDWCLYSDCDVTWLCDVSKLWDEKDPSFAIVAILDGVEKTFDREEAWFRLKGLPFDRATYFCSGVCLMNLKEFRDKSISAKINEFLDRFPDVHYPDQNALNSVLMGHIKIVSQKWNRFALPLTQNDIDGGVALHHAGEVPWKNMSGARLLSDTMLIWHKLNAEFRHISVWRSLRLYFGVGDIILHRLFCLAFRWQPTKLMLWMLISGLMRHRTTYANYVQLARKKVIRK